MHALKSMSKIHKLKNSPKIEEKLIAEFKSLKDQQKETDRRLKELKESILNFDAGMYGEYVLTFETRNVKQYVVEARTDTIIKVSKI